MLLRPKTDSPTLFYAQLPCRSGPWEPPVIITLALWESNYYRCPGPPFRFRVQLEGPPQLRQVYLRYQDPSHPNTTFKIDDSALTENGFTCIGAFPKEFSGSTLTLTSINPLCVKVYSDSLTNHPLVVGLGQYFGRGWMHVVSDESSEFPQPSWEDYTRLKYREILSRTPEYAQHMNRAPSGAERYGRIFIMHSRLRQITKILRISSVMWKSSRMCAVKLELFHDAGFGDVSGDWTAFDADGTDDPGCDWRGLMILDQPRKYHSYETNGIPTNFLTAPDGIKLGDYGHFTDPKEFCCEGNLFADLESLSSMADISPRQHGISSKDCVVSLLTSFSTRLTDRYLVTEIIQCRPDPRQPGSNVTTPLYSVAKPFVWHRTSVKIYFAYSSYSFSGIDDESAGFASDEQSDDELRSEG
ncbi:hypothetical protein SCLCIDRAFT_1225311 [Scleroderma citrinum Foug A]|uniref:Uncharacterized protein n=1 Tax=Scleroderma citrinum Foug A TaxID=1036808 RepID=A0A0C3D263_9AGAM|nr:hypothetical protein SCLCIDRAFT_1225311 [Scleroderma citrinum Foug A]